MAPEERGQLVKLLALSAEHRLHREQAMDLLWPELAPKAAANNLHYALHNARRTLGFATSSASIHLRFQGEQLALCREDSYGSMWKPSDTAPSPASAASAETGACRRQRRSVRPCENSCRKTARKMGRSPP